MDLVNCKGLQIEIEHDLEFLERRIQDREITVNMMKDLLEMHDQTTALLRKRIDSRISAIQILTDYLQTLKPAYAEVVELRLLNGCTWAEVGEATGYDMSHVQRIYKKELQRFPPEVWQRFCNAWKGRAEGPERPPEGRATNLQRESEKI